MIHYLHIPVLLPEVLDLLQLIPGQNVIDATLGGGGYTMAILEAVGSSGRVLAIDLDADAIRAFKLRYRTSHTNPILVHGNCGDIESIAKENSFAPVNAIVADIGLSSYELDEAGRGISFQKDEPLDMRFNTGSGITASHILATYSEDELAGIFKVFGEERYARAIARNIVQNRAKAPVTRTLDLTHLILASIPSRLRHTAQDSFRRIFQALRIEVNGELKNLEKFLPAAFDLLEPGGVLAVVSFHSLEDRIVKQYFQSLRGSCVCPKDFPVCVCEKTPQAEVLTKKPITAQSVELAANTRAKSAKLRAVKKL